jgi:hypothetical protein
MRWLELIIDKYDFLHKLRHWEYWPVWAVYWPVFVYYIFLSIRERSPFFFMAANPGMKNGGLFGESKTNIYNKLPKEHLPLMKLLQPGVDESEISEWMNENGLDFPLFIKPDVGERGVEVTRVNTMQEIRRWFQGHQVPAIIQEAIRRPIEVGLLYYRMPGESQGHISSLMLREMLTVTGDGRRTLREIVNDYPRARLQRKRLRKKFAAIWEKEIPAGEQLVLEHVGNHNKGTTFIDISDRINDDLLRTFDGLSKNLEDNGIFFGRYDIKCDNIEDLCHGRNFTIIELNGVASEPAHIYDPKFSLLKAYKILLSQWATIHSISRRNHEKGLEYIPVTEGIARFKAYNECITMVKEGRQD